MKSSPVEVLITTEAPIVPSIAEINSLHAAATEDAAHAKLLGESATRKAILLGLKLTTLKQATPHGQWEGLFASGQKRVGKSNANHGSHLLSFDSRTALKYISVAAQLMSQRLSSDQSAALMQLANRPGSTDFSDGESSFIDEVVPEKSLRQLYLSMGIVKPTQREAYAMSAEDDAATRKPDPKPEKGPLTLAEQRQMRRDNARLHWFGTTTPGMTNEKSSLLKTLMDEARNLAESHLSHLKRQDLIEVETTLKDLLKHTKQLIAAS